MVCPGAQWPEEICAELGKGEVFSAAFRESVGQASSPSPSTQQLEGGPTPTPHPAPRPFPQMLARRAAGS